LDKVATVRRFFDLCDRHDWDAMGELIGEGYTWIDHTAEDDAWEDHHTEIDRLTEGTDGRLFVQMTRTATLPSGNEWRGLHGNGQRVTREAIDIITFDEEGKIVGEEGYEDALSIERQIVEGWTPGTPGP